MNENTALLAVRPKPGDTNRELQFKGGVSSIGWAIGESLEGKSRGEIGEIYRSTERYKDMSGITITQIYLFVSLPKGSIILTPSYETRDIHIFRTTSKYIYRPEWEEEKNPHTINVELIKTVPRNSFSSDMQKSLNAARKTVTNFGIKDETRDYLSEVLWVVEGKSKPNITTEPTVPHSDNEAVKDAQQTLRDLLKSDNDEVRLKAALALLGKDTNG